MKLAAIDLGSNSFRLEIARVEGERIITEGSWKETIRLAAGIDKDGNLTPEAQNRGLNALARIAEKIRGMPRNHIRAVGTQTLRAAKNSQEFIERAEKILDCKVEILRGKEEARLVFQGCSFALPPSDETRLIVDIGGASTECVIGRGHEMIEGESFHVGCVNTSVTFFKDRKITAQSMERAILSAASVLDGRNIGLLKETGRKRSARLVPSVPFLPFWLRSGLPTARSLFMRLNSSRTKLSMPKASTRSSSTG